RSRISRRSGWFDGSGGEVAGAGAVLEEDVAVGTAPEVGVRSNAGVGPGAEGLDAVVGAAGWGEVAAGGLPGWAVRIIGLDVVLVAVAGVVLAPREGAPPVAQGDLFGLAVGGPVTGAGDLLVEVDDGPD